MNSNIKGWKRKKSRELDISSCILAQRKHYYKTGLQDLHL